MKGGELQPESMRSEKLRLIIVEVSFKGIICVKKSSQHFTLEHDLISE